MSKRLNNKGFTIIELMMATTVFSAILLLCTYGIIQVGNAYYKATTESRTQETARTLADRISQDVQFGAANIVAIQANSGSRGFCIGSHRYSYIFDRQLVKGTPASGQSNHVMLVDTLKPDLADPDKPVLCNDLTSALDVTSPDPRDPDQPTQPITYEELVGEGMRLMPYDTDMNHQGLIWAASDNFYSIGVKVVYGATDDLSDDHTKCSADRGNRFCAAATFITSVLPRVHS